MASFCASQYNHNLVTMRSEQQCENYHTGAWEGGSCSDVPEKFADHANNLSLFHGR